MSSYNIGGRHMPPDGPVPPADASQPGPTGSISVHGSRLLRSQLARPTVHSRINRALSLSAAEDSRSLTALPPVSNALPSQSNRLSLLPRPSTSGVGSSPSPASTVSPHTPASSIPSSVSVSDLTTPSPFTSSYQAPFSNPPKRARNVLRRKAPTIGRHVEQKQSQNLSLVIPTSGQVANMRESGLPNLPDASSTEPLTLSQSPSAGVKSNATDTPWTQEPIELASLRTVTDSQNLPPPPLPVSHYPSASTPSTRYSESPGMWSRGSTPTSLSSYSPGLVHSSKMGRMRQPSPSQTRLPVFSPKPAQASPQSAQVEQVDVKISRSGLPRKSLGLGSATLTSGKSQSSFKATPGIPASLTQTPPAKKYTIDCSPPRDAPSKNPDIDIDRARKEVEEAERELFGLQKVKTPPTSEASVPKVPQTPPRPSRKGTHRLDVETSPVIHSNLPYLKSTGHTRRESIERARNALSQSAVASTDSLPLKDVSRLPSREAAVRRSPKTLAKQPPKEKQDLKKPTTSKKFGLFSKKSKPDLESAPDSQARPTRKGPAAGTGHEGYGKYSQRGRKSSASSASGVRTRSTSTTRSTSHSVSSRKGSTSSGRPDLDLDEFLSSRLEPVFISGGGMDDATLSRTVSEQSISSMSVTSSNLPRLTTLTPSTVESTESLATSTGTYGDSGAHSELKSNLGSDRGPSDDKNRPHPRSRMPIPTGRRPGFYANSDAATTSTSLSSNTSSTVILQRPKPTPAVTMNQQNTLTQEQPQPKKGKLLRWHVFQRSRPSEPGPAVPSPTGPPSLEAHLHAAISPVLNSRPVAHYALVDADSDELDDILNHVEDSPPTEEEPYIAPVEVPTNLNIKKRYPSILLPSPPKMHGSFEMNSRPPPRTAMFNQNLGATDPESSPEDRRPRRLASVGRIPQVVSRRERQHIPAMQSFSRPFSTAESPSLMAPTLEGSSDYAAIGGPSMANVPDIKPGDWGYGINPAFSAPEAVSALEFLAGPFLSSELIHFSPSKGSPSSSSSDALAAVTAILPRPDTAPTEDEVWNEYDDLIDHVISTEEARPDDSGMTGAEDRFEKATLASKALQDELKDDNALQPPRVSPTGEYPRNSGDSFHLRRSRIVSALHSSIAPSTQASYSNLIASYGDPEIMYSPVNPTRPSLDPVQEQQSTFLQSLAATNAPRPKPNDSKDFPGCSERDWDAVTHTNMRSASLMTSRWLSFGRVLFSPAHNHVKSGAHGRILVIDGLGNDDWSFYCSLTYPDAEVYSLSGRPVSTVLPHPEAWQPPSNHHTVYHAGLQNPLPFPKDYFAVAVLRFPAASSEAVQANIIQECRRVLRSGGYIEMSLLDRDMVNMGVRTRKAVRRLKEMTCLANPRISLKPTSDSIQRLLGTQGFDNLRRCMVRIPVAGMVVRSSGSTTSSSNKSLSASATTQSTACSLPAVSVSTAPGSQTASKSSVSDDNISLGDLLSDPSPSAANDESIAKIVARVGRWWYSKCYEEPALHNNGDNDLSMWKDRRVLRECQKRGTGFRMLIAYAQKPSEKRRTASV